MSPRAVFVTREVVLAALAVCAVVAVLEDRKEVAEHATPIVVDPPPARAGFTIGDTTGHDAVSHLEWMRAPAPDRLRWSEANDFCARAGQGWRLPSRDELMTLLGGPRDPFGDTLDWYWSSTPGVRRGSAWAVGEGAWINANPVETQSRVRCVRDAW